MKYGIIRPELLMAEIVEFETTNGAIEAAGLKPGEVDFGSIARDLSIIVYQFGLYEPENMHHFSINGTLYAGGAVIYQHQCGETVDLDKLPSISFHGGAETTEAAIQSGIVLRPWFGVNEVQMWEWGPKNGNPAS